MDYDEFSDMRILRDHFVEKFNEADEDLITEEIEFASEYYDMVKFDASSDLVAQ